MAKEINDRLIREVHCEVVFFQLRSIDLPDAYEQAIEQTEVTKQGILRADALRNKNKIVQETYVEQAKIAQNITINQAKGKAMAKMLKANATADTFLNITRSQAESYATLKSNLTLTNSDLIQYLQVNLIQNYPDGNLIISIQDAKKDVVAPKPVAWIYHFHSYAFNKI